MYLSPSSSKGESKNDKAQLKIAKTNVNKSNNNYTTVRSKKKRAKGLAYGILTPETSFTTSNQEKETESTSTRPNSRIENFLLRSAASSSSINSQYSDLRNEFSKYSRPRSGKDDDWRGSPTGFSPRSSGGGVSRGIIFGGRPSTRGSDFNNIHGGDEYDEGGETDISDGEENEVDIESRMDKYRKNVHLSLIRVSCTTIQLRCENPDRDHLQMSEDGIVWRSIYWVNEPRFFSRTITCLIPGRKYFFRLERNDSIPQIICETRAFPMPPQIPTAWKLGRGMPVPIAVTTDFISVSWVNPPDVQQWELAIAGGIDGPHGLEPGTWKRCGNVGGHGQHGLAEPGRMFYEFPGLRANETYFIRIRFRNNMGWSKSSKPLEVSTAKGDTASAPKNFIIVRPVYFSYVKLEWLPPRNDGGIPLTEAVVEYIEVENSNNSSSEKERKKIILGESEDDEDDNDNNIENEKKLEEIKIQKKIQTLSAGLDTKILVPNLKPNTIYQFRVAYRNERGLGTYSPVLQAKTLKFWVPSPPEAPKLEIINGTSVKVDFDLQPHDQCIEYEVQYSKDKMFRWTSGGKNVTSPIIIDGLEDFEYYFFRVKARNKRGWSRGGEPVIGKTTASKADNKAPKMELGFVTHTPTTATLECSGRNSIDDEEDEMLHQNSKSLLLRDQSLSSTMFASSNSPLLHQVNKDENNKDNIQYQIEYTTDPKSKSSWTKLQREGDKGHVKISGLRPAMLYFARIRSMGKAKQWSKFSSIFPFVTRDYNENETVLVRGEGPWEKDEGFYPAAILKVLKPGEYYSIQREGRGFREDVVHRDSIKEVTIRKKLHAFGRIGRLLASSRKIYVESDKDIEDRKSSKTIGPGIRKVWLYGTHRREDEISKKDHFQPGRYARLSNRNGSRDNRLLEGRKKTAAELRSMSQKDLFHHKLEHTNKYLSLKGLPHGTTVQLSKVDIRKGPKKLGDDSDGLEKSRKNLRKNQRGVFYRMSRPIHLLREVRKKNKVKKDADQRRSEMDQLLRTKGQGKHIQQGRKLHRYTSPIKDQSVTMVENERTRYENKQSERKQTQMLAMRNEEARKQQYEQTLNKSRRDSAYIKYSTVKPKRS